MFRLTEEEVNLMVSQNAIPSKQHLGVHLPYVYEDNGKIVSFETALFAHRLSTGSRTDSKDQNCCPDPGSDYVEFEVDESRISIEKKPNTVAREYIIRGDVRLDSETTKFYQIKQ